MVSTGLADLYLCYLFLIHKLQMYHRLQMNFYMCVYLKSIKALYALYCKVNKPPTFWSLISLPFPCSPSYSLPCPPWIPHSSLSCKGSHGGRNKGRYQDVEDSAGTTVFLNTTHSTSLRRESCIELIPWYHCTSSTGNCLKCVLDPSSLWLAAQPALKKM